MDTRLPGGPEPMYFEIEVGDSDIKLIWKTICSVNYGDLPIIGIILAHMFWFTLFFRYKTSLLTTSIQFLISCYGIAVTERLNTFMSQRWERFHFSKDYFDANCIFAFVFWAVPLTILAVSIIISLFIDLCKAIAVHRYFKTILPKPTPQKTYEKKSPRDE